LLSIATAPNTPKEMDMAQETRTLTDDELAQVAGGTEGPPTGAGTGNG
jgi:bacteriocin-like protein